MNTYRYLVTVEAREQAEADMVMAERLNNDEDYGFPYTLDWNWL